MTNTNEIMAIKPSLVASDLLAETVYCPESKTTHYASKQSESPEIKMVNDIRIDDMQYKPMDRNDDLIKKEILKLPSCAEEYDSIESLFSEVRDFIHKYMDLPEDFEVVSAYFVLMTWVYDRFMNVPYLRVRGLAGGGKSRFLEVLGSVCYKSLIFRANPSEASIFRTIEDVKGTIGLDEFDRHFSGKDSSMTQMLNNGFAKGGTVSRCRQDKDGKYIVEHYDCYCPKIIGNRGEFKDDALESRCLTQYMGLKDPRPEVLINLDEQFEAHALSLRNKLLSFRLNEYRNIQPISTKDIPFNVSARSKQISIALYSLMKDEHTHHLENILNESEQRLIDQRDNLPEVMVLRALLTFINAGENSISVKEVAQQVNDDYESYEKLSERKVGEVLSELNIKRKKGGKDGRRMISFFESKKHILTQAKYFDIPTGIEKAEHLADFDDESTDHSECPERSGVGTDIISQEDNPFESQPELKDW